MGTGRATAPLLVSVFGHSITDKVILEAYPLSLASTGTDPPV
jgi:hypothetical protein